MIKKYGYTAILISCFLFSTLARAAPGTTPLGSYYIPGLTDSPEQGLFINFLREIEQRSQLRFDVMFKPTRRIQEEFRQGKIPGYFPELYQQLPLPMDQLLISEPFWMKFVHIFTRQNTFLIDEVHQLKGMTLALVRGYTYGEAVIDNPAIRIIYTDNDQQSLNMLVKGYVDATLGDTHATVQAIRELELESIIHYNPHKPLYQLDVFFVFQKTPQGHILNEKVSAAIRQMKADGSLPQMPDTD